MLRLRYSDERDRLIQHFKHVIGNFLTEQITVLAIDYTHPTTQISRVFMLVVGKLKPAEHCVIELPGPALIHLLDRVSPDVIKNVLVIAILRRHQSKPPMGSREIFVDSLRFNR